MKKRKMSKSIIIIFSILVLLFDISKMSSQSDINDNTNKATQSKVIFNDIHIKVDTLTFKLSKDKAYYGGEPHLPFRFFNDEQILELRLFPNSISYFENKNINILNSVDFDVLDSIVLINNEYYKTRLRCKSISRASFSAIILNLSDEAKSENIEIKVFPYTQTTATFYPSGDDLYIGEEKEFEIITNNITNLVLDGIWKQQEDIYYRLIEKNNSAMISIIPNSIGNKRLNLTFETRKPFITTNNQVTYKLLPQSFNFNVRGSRLAFLRIEPREIIKEKNNRDGFEIQIDNNRMFQIHKTYRIEDREESGGPLVAELYTVRRLNNDKVLCLIRPYLFHNSTDGYLYIKDGDNPLSVTNISITPEAKIDKITLLRPGMQRVTDNSIYPGETVEVRLEGEGFRNARFYFEDLVDVSPDTLTRNDRYASFLITVPVNVRKQRLKIFNHSQPTNWHLTIKEYQKPREFDFVYINYGEANVAVNSIKQPIFYNHNIKDIVFSFDQSLIDRGEQLYGKQFLEVDIRITGRRDELVEMKTIPLIEVCPDESSPRSAFYQTGNCNKQEIRLNSILSRKTHSLEEWSKVELTIRHKADKYSETGFTQRVEIVLQQLVNFDVELSFPAGLIIKKVGVDGFPPLGGISLAMIAQFTFFEEERIRKPKPYKIGAGFLAQNAFNFNPDVKDRDLGLVVLGSVYPTRSDARLSFPLYVGFGYFLNQSKFFYLIGPGIRINF